MDVKASTVSSILSSALTRPKSPELAFITITNPQDLKDSNNQTKIRRHARRSTVASKDQRRRHIKTIVFDLPESNSLPQTKSKTVLVQPTSVIRNDVTSGLEWITSDIEEDDESLSSSLRFLRPIGCGRGLNPLARLPTSVNARIRQILDYIYFGKKKDYRPLVDVWVTLSMSDESTFHVTMANAAVAYGADAGDEQSESEESMKYYNMSLQSVNKRLQDPVDGISEGVMGTVVGFACHDHMVRNYQRVNVHLSGLEKIIRMRGGIETLKPFHVLRLMVFRIDTSNSLLTDSPPRFPLPSDLVHHFTNVHHYNILDCIVAAWNMDFPQFADITELLTHIAKMSHHVNDTIGSMPIPPWRDEWFMVQKFLPVVHNALSLPRMDLDQAHVAPENVLREAIRLACLNFLNAMNRKFRVSLDGIVIYNAEVMKLLIRLPVPCSFFPELRLWALVIGGLVTDGEIRAWHIGEISNAMDRLGLNTWMAAHSIVNGILWVDDLLKDEREKLGLEVEEFIRQA